MADGQGFDRDRRSARSRWIRAYNQLRDRFRGFVGTGAREGAAIGEEAIPSPTPEQDQPIDLTTRSRTPTPPRARTPTPPLTRTPTPPRPRTPTPPLTLTPTLPLTRTPTPPLTRTPTPPRPRTPTPPRARTPTPPLTRTPTPPLTRTPTPPRPRTPTPPLTRTPTPPRPRTPTPPRARTPTPPLPRTPTPPLIRTPTPPLPRTPTPDRYVVSPPPNLFAPPPSSTSIDVALPTEQVNAIESIVKELDELNAYIEEQTLDMIPLEFMSHALPFRDATYDDLLDFYRLFANVVMAEVQDLQSIVAKDSEMASHCEEIYNEANEDFQKVDGDYFLLEFLPSERINRMPETLTRLINAIKSAICTRRAVVDERNKWNRKQAGGPIEEPVPPLPELPPEPIPVPVLPTQPIPVPVLPTQPFPVPVLPPQAIPVPKPPPTPIQTPLTRTKVKLGDELTDFEKSDVKFVLTELHKLNEYIMKVAPEFQTIPIPPLPAPYIASIYNYLCSVYSLFVNVTMAEMNELRNNYAVRIGDDAINFCDRAWEDMRGDCTIIDTDQQIWDLMPTERLNNFRTFFCNVLKALRATVQCRRDVVDLTLEWRAQQNVQQVTSPYDWMETGAVQEERGTISSKQMSDLEKMTQNLDDLRNYSETVAPNLRVFGLPPMPTYSIEATYTILIEFYKNIVEVIKQDIQWLISGWSAHDYLYQDFLQILNDIEARRKLIDFDHFTFLNRPEKVNIKLLFNNVVNEMQHLIDSRKFFIDVLQRRNLTNSKLQ